MAITGSVLRFAILPLFVITLTLVVFLAPLPCLLFMITLTLVVFFDPLLCPYLDAGGFLGSTTPSLP